jgi:Fe-S cluster assembly iron-binding protein IscA
MTIRITPDARRTIADWLARDPSRPALRLSFAGGCGALGYRLTSVPFGARSGEQVLSIDGFIIYADFKAASDLDRARIEVGDSPDDLLVVHEDAVAGGTC